jgi:hypothetical protein
MIPENIFQVITQLNPALKTMQNIKTPDEMAQYLLNSGKVNQSQVNQAKQMWNNQPDIRQMIQNRFHI